MQYSKRQSSRQKRRTVTVMLLVSLGLFAGCTNPAHQGESNQYGENGQEAVAGSVFSITAEDLNTDGTDLINVYLSDHENEVLIQKAGDYVLSGSLNGSICIDAEEQIVHLFLADVSVRSSFGPAISVASAGKVIITLLPGSTSTLSDSGYYQPDSEENACIYSECDLTINGSGKLSINGYYKDGIHCKDVVKLLGGELVILAKRDGIRGNDGILSDLEQLTIESEGNGLRSTKTGRNGKGTIEIAGGSISIIAGEYGVTCADALYVRDCNLYINAVISRLYVKGDSYIQEGCLENE